MNATIQSKKDRPNYYVVLDYKDDSGNRKKKWLSTDIPVKGNNKRRAEEKRKEILAEYESQKIDLSKDVLFTVFIKEWLENLKPSIDSVTYDSYKLIVDNQLIPFYTSKRLKVKDITPLHIQQYINFKLKTVSPNTVRKHLWNISKCLDSAVRQNLIASNPVKKVDLPKMAKYTGAKFYNEEQIERLLEVFKGDVIEDIVKIALFYGLRRSEIIGIKWDAINLENNTLTIRHTVVQMGTKVHKKDSTKNNSSYRTMPIPMIIKSIFVNLKQNQEKCMLLQPNDYLYDGYVFTHSDGRLITPNYVTKHFQTILKRNNLPVYRFHDLRHSSASYLLYLGFSMKEIQMWLGHGNVSTTMNIYAHLDIRAKQNIADSLNEKFVNFS